jgi:hypothetical protein
MRPKALAAGVVVAAALALHMVGCRPQRTAARKAAAAATTPAKKQPNGARLDAFWARAKEEVYKSAGWSHPR